MYSELGHKYGRNVQGGIGDVGWWKIPAMTNAADNG